MPQSKTASTPAALLHRYPYPLQLLSNRTPSSDNYPQVILFLLNIYLALFLLNIYLASAIKDYFVLYLYHILPHMLYSVSSHHLNNQSTLRLQHAIQHFKQQQLHKAALENKLHILKSKCESNRKRAKLVQTQISKLKHTKE